jgi:hypothetical protein
VTEFRIGAYNILDGAEDNRAEGQLDLLADCGLDLLFVSEAMGDRWTQNGDLRRTYEDRLGMWSRGRLEQGDGDGAGRFSVIFGRRGRLHPGRYKALGTRPRNWRGTGLLELTGEEFSYPVTVMGHHCHTLDPGTRLAEVTHTARCSIDPATGPAIMAGDWNSIHGRPCGQPWDSLPEGDPAPDLSALQAGMLPYHVLCDEQGDPILDADGRLQWDRRPSKSLQIAGFRDVVAELVEPEARPLTGGFGPRDAPRRLDRIYVRDLPPVGCMTFDGPEYAALSDHRLVLGIIDL